MSDFPEGVIAPEGAQELVDVCKETWAVTQNEASSVTDHDEAVDRFEDAMSALAELDVHVNNEGDEPVFSLGVKETAYDPSMPVSGAKFLKLEREVELKELTTLVDLSTFRKLGRCTVLVRHKAKGASPDSPSSLHKLCSRVCTHQDGLYTFCGVHKLSLKTHPDDGKIYLIKSDVVACSPKFGMALALPLPAAHIGEHCQEVGATPGMPMNTPFILSANSKDVELKSVKTIGIPEYEVVDDSDSATGSASTQSDHGSGDSRAPSPPFVFGDAARAKAKGAGGKVPAGLGMAPPSGAKPSHIDFGGGSAEAKSAKQRSKDRRKHKTGRQHPPDPHAGMPLFGSLTVAPLGQAFGEGGPGPYSQPPTAEEVALVFPPTVAQHLFGDPVGPGGQTCGGFHQPVVLERPSLEPPVTSRCNCEEWKELRPDFEADFTRLAKADENRMELSRVGEKALAKADVSAMNAANDVYESSYHSLRSTYQELLLQKEKAKKRVSAGGSVAGGDAAASSLVFEMADLLFRVFRAQRLRFKDHRQEVMQSVRERFARKESAAADAEAEAEKKKSDEAKRKNKSKKGEAKKYYAVAVGLKTGLFTTWDECERQVNRVPNCLFKGFKRKSDAQAWLWKNRRQPRSSRPARSSSDDSSGRDDGRRGRGRKGSRDRKRSSKGRSRRSGGGDGGDSDSSHSDSESDSSGGSTTPSHQSSEGSSSHDSEQEETKGSDGDHRPPRGSKRSSKKSSRKSRSRSRSHSRSRSRSPKKSPKKARKKRSKGRRGSSSRSRSPSPSTEDAVAKMAAMQLQLDQVSRKLQEQGGLVGNVYADSVVPVGYFVDNLGKFCVDENLSAKLNSASDTDKVRIKAHEKYWGGGLPHDSIGRLSQSNHVAKHIGATNRQRNSDLKQYTDAIVVKMGSTNRHADHNRMYNYPGGAAVQALYVSMWSSYEELQNFRACWQKEGEEVEERCNPTAATDDKLFARGPNAFMKGAGREQQERCLEFTQLITQLITSFLSYASRIVKRSAHPLASAASVFQSRDGHYPWPQVQQKITMVFERIWTIRKDHPVRQEGLLATAAFLSQAQRARWSIYRIDQVTLFAYNAPDSVGALAEKLGTANDPFAKVAALEGKLNSGERSIQALNRTIEELKKKVGSGNSAELDNLRKQVAGQSKALTDLTSKAADSQRDKDRNRQQQWQRQQANTTAPAAAQTTTQNPWRGKGGKGGNGAPAPSPTPAAAATSATPGP